MPTKRTVLIGLAAASLLQAQSILTTFAGTDFVFPVGKPALSVGLGTIRDISLDRDGNPVFVSNNDCMALRIQANGIIVAAAGNGFCGLSFLTSGNGGPATAAGIFSPLSVASDPQGNLYVMTSAQVRKITPDGIISTLLGTGVLGGFGGDGQPAISGKIASNGGIAADSAGNIYIADGGNQRVRKISAAGILTTFAGTGIAGSGGDGGLASIAKLSSPGGVAVDAAGNVYIADTGNGSIRKVAPDGTITTRVLTGNVQTVAAEADGTLYIGSGNALLKLQPGATTPFVLAGDINTAGFSGDGGTALKALMRGPIFGAPDGKGNVYISDSGNARIRKITPDNVIRTVGGNGNYRYTGENVLALAAPLNLPYGIAVDASGAVYFSERTGHRVRKVKNGILSTVAGTGQPAFSGDRSSAAFAAINSPQGLAFDTAGNLYIADTGNGRIRKVTPDGTITTLAQVNNPIAMTFDAMGNLLVALSGCCVVKVDAAGTVTTIAGNGTRVSSGSGDGGPAVNASFNSPAGVAVDGNGTIFISDSNGDRIRKVTPDGMINTFLGNGSGSLGFPTALRFDSARNLLIASHISGRIFKATQSGALSTIAGGGPNDQLGDGKIATSASLPVPNEMAFDAAGNLYIADEYNYRVRVIPAAPATLQVAPSNLSFNAGSGGAPINKTVTVSGSLAGLDFTVAIDTGGKSNWLTVDATGASSPRVLTLTADPTNLAPGSYTATVTITPAAATPPKLTVGVTFVVGAAQAPQLATDQPNLSFTFPRGATASSANLRISNSGGGTVNFTASAPTTTGGNFLSVSPASGKVTPGKPVTLAVTANPAGLAAGTYSGTIRVQGDAGGTLVIPVVMTVSTLTQALRLTQTGMSFSAVAQGGVVPSQTFGVVNVGTGVLNWTASTSTLSGGPNWLQIDKLSGASNAAAAAPQVTVNVDASGLAAGNYYGLVRIIAPGAANTPQVVTVFLEVLPAGSDPGALVAPQELVFNATVGADPPGAQSLLVYSIGAGSKTYVTGRPQGFSVLVAPREGVLDPSQPSRVVIQPTGGFPAGTSTQVLNFQFSDGRVQSVRLTVIATPAPASSNIAGESASPADGRSAGGCTPTRLVPALTSLGSSFSVSAGWPVALSAKVTDDCFNPQIAGSVTVSFTNGDLPISLSPLNDGTWQATWTSGRSGSSSVGLRLDAVDSKQGISGSREIDGSLKSDKDPPAFTQGSIGSAAYPVAYQPLAPGSFVSIFGSRLADGNDQAKTLPLPEQLGNTQVIIGGQIAPLHIVSEGQVNFLVPYGINANAPQQVYIQRGLTYSQPVTVDVAAAQPGIFLAGPNAIVVAVRSDGTQFLVTPDAPAQTGDTLVIYCAGLGPTDINVAAGSQTPLDRLANTASPVTVTIGDKNAPVGFAGLTPGSSGLYQVNAVVPAGITPGSAVPMTLTVAGQTSRAAPIAVR